MGEHLQVITTTGTREQALAIARDTVRAGAAACAQVIGPITSVFRWKGAVEEEKEFFCVMKTTSGRYEDLEKAIRASHTYEVPEIVALSIEKGGADYLAWIEEAVKKTRAKP